MVEDFRLLFVCTANICRSPLAEVLTRHLLWAPGNPPGGRLLIGSAGTRGRDGDAMAEGAVAVLRAARVAPARFRSRALTAALIAESDLLLTATREHRSQVLAMEPRAFGRTFTLLEFARLAADLGAPAWGPRDTFARRATVMTEHVAARRGGAPPGTPERDDIRDPYGGPAAGYHTCARQTRAALEGARLFLLGDGIRWPAGSTSPSAASDLLRQI